MLASRDPADFGKGLAREVAVLPVSAAEIIPVAGQDYVSSLQPDYAGKYLTSCALFCRLSGGRVENGKWYHVAVVKKFTELTMYVNGKPVGRATVPACYQPGPKNVGIGCNPNYTGPEVFQGALAEVLLVREEEIKKLAGALVTPATD